jgi:hypothetical protein
MALITLATLFRTHEARNFELLRSLLRISCDIQDCRGNRAYPDNPLLDALIAEDLSFFSSYIRLSA